MKPTTNEATAVVVVGIDGSADSDRALHWAHRYAEVTGASIRIVVAWHWPMSFGYPMMYDGFEPDGDAQRTAEKAVAELCLPADRVETRVAEGPAGPVLVRDSADAALLVVGRHGHRHADSLLIGSVSAHCVHAATVPVVVVR